MNNPQFKKLITGRYKGEDVVRRMIEFNWGGIDKNSWVNYLSIFIFVILPVGAYDIFYGINFYRAANGDDTLMKLDGWDKVLYTVMGLG